MQYLISDAAKEVAVETHVLRYWEEELGLTIRRNKAGHRYYTREDVEQFKRVKNMKDKGFQLKAIRMIMRNGQLEGTGMVSDIPNKAEEYTKETGISTEKTITAERDEKTARASQLLKQMLLEAVVDSNRELCTQVKDEVLKELDYQFRQQREREEERDIKMERLQEEHYKKVDSLLSESREKGKRKKHPF